jgi:hypothetical protein
VLLIAFYFPPILSGGVFRPLKYSKYLHEFGWQAIVLTAKGPSFIDYDYNLLNEVDDNVKIYRSLFVSIRIIIKKLKNIFILKIKSTKNRKKNNVFDIHNLSKNALQNNNRKQVILLKILKTFLFPDGKIFWLPLALINSLYLIYKYSIPVIWTTSPPNTSHLVGYILKKVTRVKWIIDFRDPWFKKDEFNKDSIYLVKSRLRLEKMLLRKILKNADNIINIGYGESHDLMKLFPKINQNKFKVIHNGYDIDDFKHQQEIKDKYEKLTLCHLGYLYSESANDFFEAIDEIIMENYGKANYLKIKFVGQIDPTYKKKIESCKLKGMYELSGQVQHSTAIKEIISSDILLVFLGGEKFYKSEIPGKIFEYVAAEKLILAIAKEEGETAEILIKSGLGIIVEPKKSEKIKKIIKNLINKKFNQKLTVQPNRKYIRKFDRRYLTEKFAKILDELIT